MWNFTQKPIIVAKQETGSVKPNIMDQMKLNLIRGFIPKIRENLEKVNPFVAEKLAAVPLLENETHSGYLLVLGTDNVAYMCTVTFDEIDAVKRIVEQIPATEFLENLLKLI